MAGGVARRTMLALVLALLVPVPAMAAGTQAGSPVTVKVGAYEFPPYASDTGEGVTRGFLEALNAAQPDVRFQLVLTSPQRRYEDLEQGRFDLIAFESLAWGWKGRPVDSTRVYFRDAEVFITKAGPGVGQSVFDRLEGKSILGRLGYHYAFAGYNADPDFLAKHHNTRLTVTHEGNVRGVAAGRASFAIVTRSFLTQFLKANPTLADQLLVSDRTDQIYEHTILVRRGAPVTVGWLNALLDRLEADGTLASLWTRYGIVE